MNKSTALSLVGVCIAAATVAATALSLSRQPSRNSTNFEAKPVPVVTQTPVRRTFVRKLSLPGTLEPFERAMLYAKVTGYLDVIHVDRGSRVRGPADGKPGRLLAVVLVPEMQAELAVLEAMKLEADASVLQAQADRQSARFAKLEAQAAVAVANSKIDQVAASVGIVRADRAKCVAESALADSTGKRFAELRKANSVTDQEALEAQTRAAVARASLDAVESRVAVLEADRLAAKAAVDEASAKVARAEAKALAAEAALQVADARRAVAQAKIDQAKVLMQYAEIRAPFDGVVVERWVDRGTFIQAGTSSKTTALLEVARDDVLRGFVEVPEADVPFIAIGALDKPETGSRVEIVPHAFPGKVLAGHVVRTAGGLSPATRTLRVEVELKNPPHPTRPGDFLLKPGMFAAVGVVLDTRTNSLSIPTKALQVRQGATGVFVVRDGKAGFVLVKTGYEDGTAVEVLGGLTQADVVVTEASAPLADGLSVAAKVR